MTALGIEISSRDPDLAYWPKPSTHGKSPEYLAVSDKIDELWARYLRLCDVEPLPQYKLDEIEDEIKRLDKQQEYLWKRDQRELAMLIERQKQLETVTCEEATVSAQQTINHSKRSIS